LTSDSKLDILGPLKHIPGQFLQNLAWWGPRENLGLD
jgi:hypothetical protein